jgi:hypothetical protein
VDGPNPEWGSVEYVRRWSGEGRSRVYERIAQCQYVAKKAGRKNSNSHAKCSRVFQLVAAGGNSSSLQEERVTKMPQNATNPAAGERAGFGDSAFPGGNSTSSIAQNPAVAQAAAKDLTIEASVEAAHIAAIAAAHFVEDMETGDLWAAEHNLGVAVAHLREAASRLRAWQGKLLPDREAAQ